MERIEDILTTLDYLLDTPRKRHIVGGTLISASVLFGALALTVLTIRREMDK